MGRRVKKTVYAYSSGAWDDGTSTLFVYDRWSLIEELDDTQAVQKAYVWGLDLSQSIQGAGAVGGLIATVDDAVTYLYSFDGNGNVGQVIDSTDGSMDARYEYDPFGKVLVAVGDYADENVFKFSTKYFDDESGLIYYGYRYYSPELGRWINRDPMGENGGVNLCGFIENDSINLIDLYGLALYAFDGTGNNDRKVNKGFYTNVYILKEVYQGNVDYHTGVGSAFLQRSFGGLTGAGGQGKIMSAYKQFLKFYEAGDKEIDIIGFSRGASLAREFANVLNDRGYIKHYGTIFSSKGCPVEIRFVGLFDTVGSFGIAGNKFNYRIRMDLPKNVKNAAHATANDEKRYLFPLSKLNYPEDDQKQHFIEQGFSGDHSDIGRGHGPDTNELSIEPLEFIWREGIAAGTPFGPLPPFKGYNNRVPHDLSKEFPHSWLPEGRKIYEYD